MISDGFVRTEKLSKEDIKEITKTAELLSIEMTELYHEKSVPGFVEYNKIANSLKPKKLANDLPDNGNDENSESIIDVMDSFIRIFEPGYKGSS